MTAVEKRIKKKILGVPQEAVIRFPKGLGDVCEAEVREALAHEGERLKFSPEVELTASAVLIRNVGFADLLALTLRLTTAREILWPIAHGPAETAKQLATRLEDVDWELYLSPGLTLGVRVASTASRLFHEGRLRATIEAALARHGVVAGPVKGAGQLLDARLEHDRLTLSLSVAGRPLHQRRYKTELKGAASVKEDIAAGATRLALAFARETLGDAWQPRQVVAPFAGSGTLGFEALLALGGLPPGHFFGALAAEAWPCCPAASLRFARRKMDEAWRERAARGELPPVRFVELDPEQSGVLTRNAEAFRAALSAAAGDGKAVGTAPPVDVVTADALDALADPGSLDDAFVAANPPYGRRLSSSAPTVTLYRRLGRLLAAGRAAGYVLAPTDETAKAFAAAFPADATRSRDVLHGGKTVRIVTFLTARCSRGGNA